MSAAIAHLPLPHLDAVEPEPELKTEFDELPAVMSPKVLGEVLEVSPKTLERWRDAGTGPAFLKLPGSSLLRYTRRDVVAWLLAAREGAAS